MSEQLASVLFWLIILIPLGVFARQIQQVRRGRRSKFKAAIVFFTFSILPVLLYALLLLVLVGIEEFTKLPMIMEETARTFLLVAGIGLAEVLLLTAILSIALWFLRAPGDAA